MDTTLPAATASRHPTVALDGHRRVSIRPIEPSDTPALSAFYDGLSAESSRRRFLGCSRSRPPAAEIDGRDAGLVAELVEPGPRDGAIVGHAALHLLGSGRAEAAFAVADDLQRGGIGTALMREAIRRARSLGLQRLEASTFAENAAMRRILLGAGRPILGDVIDAGIEEIALDLSAPLSDAAAQRARQCRLPRRRSPAATREARPPRVRRRPR